MHRRSSSGIPIGILICFPVALLVLFFAYGFSPVLETFSAHFHLSRDHFNYVLPKLTLMADALRQGQMPLWNVGEGAGIPLFAAGSKPVFLTPLLLFLDPASAIPVMAALEMGMALLLCYPTCRALGLSPWGAAVAATIWGFCGYHSQHINDIALVGTTMWMPVFLLAFLRLEKGVSLWSALAMAAFSMAMQTTGGRPSEQMYNLIFVALVVAWRHWNSARSIKDTAHSLVKPALIFLCAAVLGLVMAAVFVLPFVDYLKHTTRFLPQYVYAGTSTLSFRALPGLFLPGNYPCSLLHVGLVTAPLLLAARHSPHRDMLRFCLWTMGVTIALVMPLGLFELIRLLPMHAGANTPTRMLPYFFFTLGLAAGMGFDALSGLSIRENARPSRWALPFFLAIGVSVTIWFTLAALNGGSYERLRAATMALETVACLTLWPLRTRRGIISSGTAMIILLFAGMFLTNQLTVKQHLPNKEGYLHGDSRIEGIRFLAKQPNRSTFRIHVLPHTLNGSLYPIREGLQQPFFYEAAPDASCNAIWERMLAGSIYPGALDVNNVCYILGSDGSLPDWTSDYPVVFHGNDGSVVMENTDVLPRAFVARRFVVEPDKNKQLDKVTEQPTPADTVYLEKNPDLPISPGSTPSRAHITRYSPLEVAVRVEGVTPGLLVLLDSYSPSWIALVDGKPRPILRADYKFRAVAVDAGAHDVVFRYAAPLERKGLAISAVATAVVALMFLAGLRSQRARRKSDDTINQPRS